MTMYDPSAHPLVQAASKMTGLRPLSPEEQDQFKTQADVDAFDAATGRVTEYNDLMAIVNATHWFMQKNRKARVIHPSDLIPLLEPSIEGDKRRKSFQEACEQQMTRMKKALEQAQFDIRIKRKEFSLDPR